MTDGRFAKDVARELDRRKQRRRLLFLLGIAAVIALAIMYLRCGSGWGLGGTGTGSGNSTGTPSVDAGPHRCQVRVAANGITVDRKLVTRAQALEVCRRTAGADVVVTGDAREGDWAELQKAFKAAKVDVFLRSPR